MVVAVPYKCIDSTSAMCMGCQGRHSSEGTLLNEKCDKQCGRTLCLFHTVCNWKVWFSDTHLQWWLQGVAPATAEPLTHCPSPSFPLVAVQMALCRPKRATEASHGTMRPMLCPWLNSQHSGPGLMRLERVRNDLVLVSFL